MSAPAPSDETDWIYKTPLPPAVDPAHVLPPADIARAVPHVRALVEKHAGLPAQGTDEWLEQRRGKITASNVATILGDNPYKSSKRYFEEKTGQREDEISPFARKMMDFGSAHEERAICSYVRQHYAETDRPQRHVFTFGMVTHPEHTFLAGSIDGLTEDGVVLEIKCPQKRVIVPGECPVHYVGQVQTLLEIFDLEEAHFVQWKRCVVTGKEVTDVTIMRRDRAWFALALPILRAFRDRVNAWRREHPRP